MSELHKIVQNLSFENYPFICYHWCKLNEIQFQLCLIKGHFNFSFRGQHTFKFNFK